MKRLLIATAVIELGAGLALLCCPSAAVAVLLGSHLDTSAALALGRLAGVALLALGGACWFAQRDPQSCAARGVVAAMTFYNLGAVAVLAYGGLGLRLPGIGLWPAVLVHAALTPWCLACLKTRRLNSTSAIQL